MKTKIVISGIAMVLLLGAVAVVMAGGNQGQKTGGDEGDVSAGGFLNCDDPAGTGTACCQKWNNHAQCTAVCNGAKTYCGWGPNSHQNCINAVNSACQANAGP